jgi:hypothetical protein
MQKEKENGLISFSISSVGIELKSHPCQCDCKIHFQKEVASVKQEIEILL